jgi:hypothetical protein
MSANADRRPPSPEPPEGSQSLAHSNHHGRRLPPWRCMSERAIAMAVIVGVLIGAPSAAFGGQAEGKKYAGRAVVDVLRELQATTLKIIFSTELVPPALRVVREPRATDARGIALQILEPHGLTLQEGPGRHAPRYRDAAAGARAAESCAAEEGPGGPSSDAGRRRAAPCRGARGGHRPIEPGRCAVARLLGRAVGGSRDGGRHGERPSGGAGPAGRGGHQRRGRKAGRSRCRPGAQPDRA